MKFKQTLKQLLRDMPQSIDVDQIATNLDIKTYRYYVPNEVYFMLNNTCVVNCQYCYADRQTKVTNALPFERVKELIKETHVKHAKRSIFVGVVKAHAGSWQLRHTVLKTMISLIRSAHMRQELLRTSICSKSRLFENLFYSHPISVWAMGWRIEKRNIFNH